MPLYKIKFRIKGIAEKETKGFSSIDIIKTFQPFLSDEKFIFQNFQIKIDEVEGKISKSIFSKNYLSQNITR